MITRGLIEWCDKTFKDALYEENERKADTKAFVSGAVEGFADAAIMFYLPTLIAAYMWMHKAKKK